MRQVIACSTYCRRPLTPAVIALRLTGSGCLPRYSSTRSISTVGRQPSPAPSASSLAACTVQVGGDTDQSAAATVDLLDRVQAKVHVDGAEFALAADRVLAATVDVLRHVVEERRRDTAFPQGPDPGARELLGVGALHVVERGCVVGAGGRVDDNEREPSTACAHVLEAGDQREQRLGRLGRPGQGVPLAAVEQAERDGRLG